MGTTITDVGGINASLAPDAFHRWATHYYQCRHDFRSPHRFSPVPYFLLCRSIELEIKSRHLRTKTQDEVKDAYWHDLKRAYDALPGGDQTLTQPEVAVLEAASKIYTSKGFEYFDPQDALTGYSLYPNLDELDGVAKKLIGHGSQEAGAGISP